MPENIYFCHMQLIDTHNHIYLPEFDGDRDEVIQRSLAAGVRRLYTDPKLAASMGAAGKTCVQYQYDRKTISTQLETLLRELVG